MRRMSVWILLPLLLLLLSSPASAASAEETAEVYEKAADIDGLERAAKEAGGIAEYGVSLDEGLAELFEVGKKSAGGIVREAVRSGVLLMGIVLFCAFADAAHGTIGKNGSSAAALAK